MVQDRQDNYKLIYERAVKLLSNRMHTKEELRRKLALRKFDQKGVDAVLKRLEELKVLNDERFAEIFLDNLIRYKTYGFYGLKMKLLQRGVNGNLVERLLSENLDADKELKIAQKLSGKYSDSRKFADALKRKGFRSEVIARLVKGGLAD